MFCESETWPESSLGVIRVIRRKAIPEQQVLVLRTMSGELNEDGQNDRP